MGPRFKVTMYTCKGAEQVMEELKESLKELGARPPNCVQDVGKSRRKLWMEDFRQKAAPQEEGEEEFELQPGGTPQEEEGELFGHGVGEETLTQEKT